jgi:hypothetical protein
MVLWGKILVKRLARLTLTEFGRIQICGHGKPESSTARMELGIIKKILAQRTFIGYSQAGGYKSMQRDIRIEKWSKQANNNARRRFILNT